MPDARTDTAIQYRVVCDYVEPQDLTKQTANLWGTVGVTDITSMMTSDGVVFTVTVNPNEDEKVMIKRLKKLAASWGKEPDGFPARVEV